MTHTLRSETYYQAFDTAFKTIQAAEKVLEGWEHKERMKEVFVILEGDSPECIDLFDRDYPHYYHIDAANEHIQEELLYPRQ